LESRRFAALVIQAKKRPGVTSYLSMSQRIPRPTRPYTPTTKRKAVAHLVLSGGCVYEFAAIGLTISLSVKNVSAS
jgi:hypothetical protein